MFSATGTGPCQVTPPSLDQIRLMSLVRKPLNTGLFVVVV